MRETITFITALFLILTSCTKKKVANISYPEYYRGTNAIRSLVNNNQLEDAILQFDNISARIPHIPSNDLLWMAQNCGRSDKCDLAAKYLELAIENGQEYGEGIGAYKTVDNCQEKIKSILLNEDKTHGKHFIYKYKSTIDSMFELEQNVRMSEDYDLMKVMDSLHLIKMLEMTAQYGFPSEKIIGHKTASRAFIIFCIWIKI